MTKNHLIFLTGVGFLLVLFPIVLVVYHFLHQPFAFLAAMVISVIMTFAALKIVNKIENKHHKFTITCSQEFFDWCRTQKTAVNPEQDAMMFIIAGFKSAMIGKYGYCPSNLKFNIADADKIEVADIPSIYKRKICEVSWIADDDTPFTTTFMYDDGYIYNWDSKDFVKMAEYKILA